MGNLTYNFLQEISRTLRKVNSGNKLLVLAGDVNIERYMFNITESFNLQKLISEYTKITHNTNCCIVNILTNIENWASFVSNIHVLDHKGYLFLVHVTKNLYIFIDIWL